MATRCHRAPRHAVKAVSAPPDLLAITPRTAIITSEVSINRWKIGKKKLKSYKMSAEKVNESTTYRKFILRFLKQSLLKMFAKICQRITSNYSVLKTQTWELLCIDRPLQYLIDPFPKWSISFLCQQHESFLHGWWWKWWCSTEK